MIIFNFYSYKGNKIIKWLCIIFFIFLQLNMGSLLLLPIDKHILHKKYCFVNLVLMNDVVQPIDSVVGGIVLL